MATTSTPGRVGAVLRRFALGYPGAYEEFPWGERALKVEKKVFVFMRYGRAELSLSVKLPASHGAALMLSFAEPTGYGLGKAGWVTVPLRAEGIRLQLLRDWIEESYRIVAPSRLVAELDARSNR